MEKRKRIQHELETAIPQDYEGRDEEGRPLTGRHAPAPNLRYVADKI